uniref:uncharacterized protein LOC117608091 isoform X2 n=1 Tax=Osmia lignaria TaxID=473952 RepID=UPI001478963B|nr:uncharacterized protein LOC117608091 isoform X2 [Osmia lignaria]
MEPLFRLDIDILLTSIKQKLMQHDENAQMRSRFFKRDNRIPEVLRLSHSKGSYGFDIENYSLHFKISQ